MNRNTVHLDWKIPQVAFGVSEILCKSIRKSFLKGRETMNNVCITGRLGGDAELRYTTGGIAVSGFQIAVDRFGKDRDGEKKKPLWFRINLWGKQAESLKTYLTKGKMVGIQGEIDIREWQDKEGQKRTSVEINARQVTLLGGGEKASERPAQSNTEI